VAYLHGDYKDGKRKNENRNRSYATLHLQTGTSVHAADAYAVCAVDWLLVWIDCVQFQWWPSTAPGARLASTRGRGEVASGESATCGIEARNEKPSRLPRDT
jgi:hypothetical protein